MLRRRRGDLVCFEPAYRVDVERIRLARKNEGLPPKQEPSWGRQTVPGKVVTLDAVPSLLKRCSLTARKDADESRRQTSASPLPSRKRWIGTQQRFLGRMSGRCSTIGKKKTKAEAWTEDPLRTMARVRTWCPARRRANQIEVRLSSWTILLELLSGLASPYDAESSQEADASGGAEVDKGNVTPVDGIPAPELVVNRQAMGADAVQVAQVSD